MNRLCEHCGADIHDTHRPGCRFHNNVTTLPAAEMERRRRPRRFRVKTQKHPNGSDSPYVYGCYFPLTDLVVGDMGGRGTGKPEEVEWLD